MKKVIVSLFVAMFVVTISSFSFSQNKVEKNLDLSGHHLLAIKHADDIVNSKSQKDEFFLKNVDDIARSLEKAVESREDLEKSTAEKNKSIAAPYFKEIEKNQNFAANHIKMIRDELNKKAHNEKVIKEHAKKISELLNEAEKSHKELKGKLKTAPKK